MKCQDGEFIPNETRYGHDQILSKNDISNMSDGELKATIKGILTGLKKRIEEFRDLPER